MATTTNDIEGGSKILEALRKAQPPTSATHKGRIQTSRVLEDGQRVGPGGYKKKSESLPIEELWGRHHEVARLAICGLSDTAIAEELGISSATVGRIRQLPAVKEKLRMLNETKDVSVVQLPVAKRIKALADMAVRRMAEVLDNDVADEDIRGKALQIHVAKDVLDRAGHSAVKRTVSINTHEVSIDQRTHILDSIRSRAISKGIVQLSSNLEDSDNQIIDITPEESNATTNDIN